MMKGATSAGAEQGANEAKALECKERGNQLYKQKKFLEAAQWYTEGVQCQSPSLTVQLYGNRSAVYIELGKRTKEGGLREEVLKRAVRDGVACVERDPEWGKGYARLASALKASGKEGEAYGVLLKGQRVLPECGDIRERLGTLKGKLGRGEETGKAGVWSAPVKAASAGVKAESTWANIEAWIQDTPKSPEKERAWIESHIGRENEAKVSSQSGRSATQTGESSGTPRATKNWWGDGEHPGKKFVHLGPVPPQWNGSAREEEESDSEEEVADQKQGRKGQPPKNEKRAGKRSSQPEGQNGHSASAKEGKKRMDPTTSSERKGEEDTKGKKGEVAGEEQEDESSSKPGGLFGLFSRMFSSKQVPSEQNSANENVTGTPSEHHTQTELTPSPPGLSRWSSAIGPDRMYEWLLDCYRFQEASSPESLNSAFHAATCPRLALLPFLLFCKMSQERGLIPPAWEWGELLTLAKADVWRKLSFEEAVSRYGRMAMLQPKQDTSPNFIAISEGIYGCTAGETVPEETRERQKELCHEFFSFCCGQPTDVFDSVGGMKKWEWLAKREPPATCKCKKTEWAKQFDDEEDEEGDRWDSRWEVKEDWARIGTDGSALNL